MKRFYLLFFLSPLLSIVQAQPFSLQVDHLQSAPEFSLPYLMAHNVKSVRIITTKLLKPGLIVPQQELVREYSPMGQLSQEIEMLPSEDTSRIASFYYNNNGFLGWKQTTDFKWGKTYRTGYRFNSARQVFQVRDYEMLANEQVMLLDTRQYIYDSDSQLVAIRWRQGSTITKVHRYAYHPTGLLAEERFENGAGEVEKIVTYTYYDNGAIQTIGNTDAEGNTETYTFIYDERGLPTKVDWKQGDLPKGSIEYAYNEEGVLLSIGRTIVDQPKIFQSFSYEQF